MKKRFCLWGLTVTDFCIWGLSSGVIIAAFLLFGGEEYLNFAASLIGTASLVFNAKGNPVGQALMIIFSLFYGIISFGFAYYGEMITYIGMTAPMAAVALISWLRHPFAGNRAEVAVNSLKKKDIYVMFIWTAAVTTAFYFILKAFETASLELSTLSVLTSFVAAFLTYKRSPYFALAYAANDIVLIALWVIASTSDPAYVSVIVCFLIFFANDIYGFISWQRMRSRQKVLNACNQA